MLINLIASVCFAFHKLLISMKSKHPFSQDGKSHILSLSFKMACLSAAIDKNFKTSNNGQIVKKYVTF